MVNILRTVQSVHVLTDLYSHFFTPGSISVCESEIYWTRFGESWNSKEVLINDMKNFVIEKKKLAPIAIEIVWEYRASFATVVRIHIPER